VSENAERLRREVIDRVLSGPGRSSADERRAAFENRGVAEPMRPLVDKVTRNAWKVTEEDVAAPKAAGVAEDEIFELVVAASLGQSARQLQAALAAIDAATKEAP
jgi:hypothetical protein